MHTHHKKTFTIQEMKLTYFWAKITHVLKIWFLGGLCPMESSSHMFKGLILHEPLIKNT
jgi:hypothetical protein